MAKLSVTEYEGLAIAQLDNHGNPIVAQAGHEPAITRQTLTYTSATATSVFNTNTKFVRLSASADLYYEIGTTPNTASAGSTLLPSGVVEIVGVKGGDSISAYDGST